MIFPNKVIPIKQSILYRSTFILKELSIHSVPLQPDNLYKNVDCHFDDINDFILALDLLYLVDSIDVTEKGGLYIAEKNNL